MRATTALFCLTAAVACSMAVADVDPSEQPASAEERARARAEREARARALEEQGGRRDAGKPAATVDARPAPPPPPPPTEPAAADASTDAADDGGAVEDAAADAAAQAKDAGGPSLSELCRSLCARAMKCASRMLDDVDVPPEVARRLREQMEESERRCRDECQSKGEASDEERIARAEKCVAEQDCDAFMKCMNDVMD